MYVGGLMTVLRKHGVVFDQDTAPGNGGAASKDTENKQSNNQNNVDDLDNLWNTDVENDPQKTKNNQNEQTNKPTKSADEIFTEHLNSLNFTDKLDANKLAEEIRDGNLEGLINVVNQAGRNAYKQALMTANGMIEKRISKAVDEAVQRSTAQNEGSFAIKRMEERLPFTKDQLHAPVAQSVLKRLIDKGVTVDKAIENVQKYYQKIYNLKPKDLGIANPPPSRPGSTRLNTSANIRDQGNEDDEIDWMTLLGGETDA